MALMHDLINSKGEFLSPNLKFFPKPNRIYWEHKLIRNCDRCTRTIKVLQHPCHEHSPCTQGRGASLEFTPFKCEVCLTRLQAVSTRDEGARHLLSQLYTDLKARRQRAGGCVLRAMFSSSQTEAWFLHWVPPVKAGRPTHAPVARSSSSYTVSTLWFLVLLKLFLDR